MTDICTRVKRKLWALVRLREAGGTRDHILSTYLVKIRHIIEYGVPLYGCLLSGIQFQTLEDLQARALRIILGSDSRSYTKNLETLGVPRLNS